MSNERTKGFLRRVATEATILATDANKTGTILTMSEQFSRRDFLKISSGIVGLFALPPKLWPKSKSTEGQETESTSDIQVYVSDPRNRVGVAVFHDKTKGVVQIWNGPIIDTFEDVNFDGTTTPAFVMTEASLLTDPSRTPIIETRRPPVRSEKERAIVQKYFSSVIAMTPELLALGERNDNPNLPQIINDYSARLVNVTGHEVTYGITSLVITEERETGEPLSISLSIKTDPASIKIDPSTNMPIINPEDAPKTRFIKLYPLALAKNEPLDKAVQNSGGKLYMRVDHVNIMDSAGKTDEFIKIQDIFNPSTFYLLEDDGKIIMDIGDGGTKIVPDIQVHPDGTMTFTYDGQEFQADPDSLEVSGQTISFKDQDGKTWVFDGKELAQATEYLSSADGTVLWTKEGMANGELRVKDEKAKELRNDTLKALWAVNNALVNPAYINDTPQEIIDDHKAFLSKFPTANALINYVENGGEPVDFIYIPVNNSQALSARHLPTAMIQKLENIDLSKIIIGFDILPKSELRGVLSLDEQIPLAIDSPYVEFGGGSERLLVETVKLPDSQTVLSWKFNSIIDYEINADKAFGRVTLYQEQSPSDKLLGATVLAKTGLDLTASLLPKHTEINKAITPPVLLSYYNLRRIYKDKITDERYYQKASNLTKSYFELP